MILTLCLTVLSQPGLFEQTGIIATPISRSAWLRVRKRDNNLARLTTDATIETKLIR